MKRSHKILSMVITLILILNTVSVFTLNTSADVTENTGISRSTTTNDYGLSDKIEGSQILHCWCWSFNTIKNEIPKIAAAGFSAIQTSPISECVVGDNGGMQLMGSGKWYYHYQPTDYKIGNYQLGTLEEYKQMCEVAKEYGVKVIVDVVANHVTGTKNAISDNINNIEGGAFHNKGYLSDYSSREKFTQQDLLGLSDLNTQNPNVQSYIKNYLIECVTSGASGFRYDAARHIELPIDNKKYASDFWPVVLQNGAEFQYGEVLQGGDDKLSDYAKLMHVVASDYGDVMQSALKTRILSAETLSDYRTGGVSADRLVPWIESHDTYCGGDSWSVISKTDTVLGWAVLASRDGTTPLFFARPDGSTQSNQWGKNQIGIAGDGTYYSTSVSAVNRFKNEMSGESERLTNPGGNTSVLMIERGTKGAVIVNASDKDFSVNAESVLSDGVYTDHISGGVFTVRDGVIKGSVAKRSVAVVYNSEHSYPAVINFSYTEQIIHNGIRLTVSAEGAENSYYTVNDSDGIAFNTSADIDLREYKQGDEITVTVYADNSSGSTVTETHTYKKIDTPIYDAETAVYFNDSQTSFDNVYAYVYWFSGGQAEENYPWPGIQISKLTDNFYGYVMPDRDEMYVIFSDGITKIPEAGPDFVIKRGEHKLYAFGEYTDYTSEGEVIKNISKSFSGKEYIYFDPSPCSWFGNDKAVPVIKLDDKDFEIMEQVQTTDGKVLWRYLPAVGQYNTMAIARRVGASTYNTYETEFDGSCNLYISDASWRNGGHWTTLADSVTALPGETDPTDTTEATTATGATNTTDPNEATASTDPSSGTSPTEVITTSSDSTEASSGTTAAVTIPSVTSSTAPYDTSIMYGDADQNGSVNVKDATLIQKHVAGILRLEGKALLCSDANRDNSVNVKDATTIQKYVAGLISRL